MAPRVGSAPRVGLAAYEMHGTSGRPGEEAVLYEIGVGSLFGEIAMLGGLTRTASVRAAIPALW